MVRSWLGAPIYDVCENFSLGGFGCSRARGRLHGERRARTGFDDDLVFPDDDVVDEILQVDARGCAIAAEECLA